MNATLYTGNGTSSTVLNGVSGQSFQPDLVWIKSRGTANQHNLIDSVRGVGFRLRSDGTNADEATPGTFTLNSNGFTTTTSNVSFNTNGDPLVAWNFKAGGTAVTNTSGTISSQVSANTTSGFSIVTYTGTGANATVGHGLGVAPSMIIAKRRSTTGYWPVYHISLGNNQGFFLNLTNAVNSQPNLWNSTTPTSSVFTVGTDTETNASGTTLVAYCWAPIAGYSAFGSYTGNGSTDGPFVYLGFRPRFVLIKASSRVDDWKLIDTSRDTYNLSTQKLYPNLSAAENGSSGETSATNTMDILSNGFKLRTSNSGTNESAATYIYACFAENPFKYANAR